MTDSTPEVRQLHTLNFVEKRASSDLAACCGCSFYWEDPQAGVRAFGFCRRHPPQRRDFEPVQPYDSPSVDYNWFCGEFVRGLHPAVVAQRAVWRQELVNKVGE